MASSVDLGDEYRNELVTSMDFLDVESYPWISFRSCNINVDGDISGSDINRDLSFELEDPLTYGVDINVYTDSTCSCVTTPSSMTML